MSTQSYGGQMQMIRADQTLRDYYFDPAAAEDGDRVPYRDETDGTDDRCWDDAEQLLRQRGLCLIDDGDGYVVSLLTREI